MSKAGMIGKFGGGVVPDAVMKVMLAEKK